MTKSVIKIGIVEDEVLIADSLARNLSKHGYTVIPYAIDYDEAIEMIDTQSPDLIILDINLEEEKNGIQVAQYIQKNHNTPFIYLTSHIDSDTLSLAKETSPSGYLTKPFHFESLYTTIEVALHNFKKEKNTDETVVLNTGTLKEKVSVKDILYLKSDHVYVEVFLTNKTLLIRSSLKNLLETLPKNIFFQVHRSYAVNIDHIVSFGAGIVFVSETEIPVSRTYQQELLERLK
ncbi:MAG: response regulator [Crocinitomicaceae bacterium]|nr:response regulator [Flavobacteriales bacterium]NQZ37141.1 response regulator [Crocinitomicaceae bacterium]